jgi:formylmethanofuran dehydrogenase subunit E
MLDQIPVQLRDKAERFHGHLGPYLVIGLKAGLYANRILGKNPFETKAVIETKLNPPWSCVADGVQFVTGCTMGKGNIKLIEGDKISFIFMRESRKLKLSLREEIHQLLKLASSRNEMLETSLSLCELGSQDIFDIEL